MPSFERLLRMRSSLTMIVAPPVKAGGWGVETSTDELGHRLSGGRVACAYVQPVRR